MQDFELHWNINSRFLSTFFDISSLFFGILDSWKCTFVKELVKEESINLSVTEKCAWTKANSCRWRTDVSFTRWAPRRVPRERRWPSRRSCGRRGRSSFCERCRSAGNWVYTRSRESSGQFSARTPPRTAKRGRRWAYDAFYAPSSSEDEMSQARELTSSSSAVTSTPIADEVLAKRYKISLVPWWRNAAIAGIKKTVLDLGSILWRENEPFFRASRRKMHLLINLQGGETPEVYRDLNSEDIRLIFWFWGHAGSKVPYSLVRNI